MEAVEMRLLGPGDSLDDLTGLLNRAYAELAAAGFNYTAATQDAVVTGRRVAVGECWLACVGGTVAGTATITLRPQEILPPPYPASEIPFLNQVAVDLPFRGRGIGDRLLERCEARARQLGRPAIGLDTAEGAKHLVAWYARRGYREVGHHQWPGKTYRSVVMLKEFTDLR